MENNLFICFILLFLSIVYSDIRFRIVVNSQILIALILVLVSSFYGFKLNLKISIIFFLFSLFLWWLNLFGGGDAKLISVLSLGIKDEDITLFILLIGIFGLVLGICTLIVNSKRAVPYAPAISLAHLIIFYFYKGQL